MFKKKNEQDEINVNNLTIPKNIVTAESESNEDHP